MRRRSTSIRRSEGSRIQAAREQLVGRGVEVSEVFHAGTPGAQFQPDGTSGRVSGPAADHAMLTDRTPAGQGEAVDAGERDPGNLALAGDLAVALGGALAHSS